RERRRATPAAKQRRSTGLSGRTKRPGWRDAETTSRRFHLRERALASLPGRKQRLRFCGAQLRPSQFKKLKYPKAATAATKLTTKSTNHRWGFLRGSVEKGLCGSKIIAVNA